MNKAKRLNPPMGTLIDRERTLAFCFEGQSYEGVQGDTLASALLANGRFLLSRSFKYHRPRGPLTLAGQDANTLVQLGDDPNCLADRVLLEDQMSAAGQNCNGSLDRDGDAILGKFSRFMPVGFYYRAFFKSPFASIPFLKHLGSWAFWEGLIRRKAGLGVLTWITQRLFLRLVNPNLALAILSITTKPICFTTWWWWVPVPQDSARPSRPPRVARVFCCWKSSRC